MGPLFFGAIYRTRVGPPMVTGLARLQACDGNTIFFIHRRPDGRFRLTVRELNEPDADIDTRHDYATLGGAFASPEIRKHGGALPPPPLTKEWMRFANDDDAIEIPLPPTWSAAPESPAYA